MNRLFSLWIINYIYEKAIRNIDNAYSIVWHFERVFGVVQPQFGQNFDPFPSLGRNMNSPKHIRDQAAIETVDFLEQMASNKVKLNWEHKKILLQFFWYAIRIIQLDYRQKGRISNKECNTNLLGRFNDDTEEKRQILAKKEVLFHKENAKWHTGVLPMPKFNE